MLSCKKATEMVEKKTVTSLSFIEKLKLKMHLSMCDACKAYEKQSKIIDNFLHKNAHSHTEENIPVTANMELQKQILSKL